MSNIQFLVICVALRPSIATNDVSMKRMTNVLQNVCPGALVCRGEQTSAASSADLDYDFISCCNVSACSCQEDCYETGNCCFPSNHHTNPDCNTNNIKEFEQSCLFLTTETPPKNMITYYQKYNMITSVKEPSYAGENDLSGVECGSQNVAPWGSLFPIFSKRKNRLYKNMACATSDGSSDAIYFDVYLICDQYESRRPDFSYFIENIWTLMNSRNECRILFKYPGDTKDLKWHQCFNDLIDSCQASFTILAADDFNHTHYDVVSECDSGRQSRVKEKKMYSNVFCYVCKKSYFRQDLTCAISEMTRAPTNGYTILIDTDFISNFKAKRKTSTACQAEHNNKCRPVICPSGQLYDHLGQCIYLSQMWFVQMYRIVIKLTSKFPINETELKLIRHSLLEADFVLNSPWPKQWYIKEVYSPLSILDQEYFYLLIIIENERLKVRPHVLKKTIEKRIYQEWTLELANKSFAFMSDFNPFYLTFDYEENNELFTNQTQKTFYSQYREVYNIISHLPKSILSVTKLFLCNQIELTSNEFLLNSRMNILFNNRTNEYLFGNDFLLSTSTSGMETAKVCIKDSGFKELNDQSVNSSVGLHDGLFDVLTLCMLGQLYRL